MFSNLLNKVGWGELPGYTIEPLPDDQSSIPGNPLWILSRGKNKLGERVTIFHCNKKKSSPGQLECARGTSGLKTLRHPLILQCLDYFDNDNGIYLVTEEVTPFKSDEKPHVWGIHQIIRAVSFLHRDGKAHGIVDVVSIFLTKTGDYRLGGFELCGPQSQASSGIVRQRQILQLANSDPDLPMHGDAKSLDEHGVEHLVRQCFSVIPPSLKPLLNRGRTRSSGGSNFVDQLLKNQCFTENAEVKTMSFLEDLHIKDDSEKEKFFELLPSVCDHLGKDLRRYQLLGHLVKAVEFANLTASVLVSILKIAPECLEEDYKEIILPIIIKYFNSTDRGIRFRLLQSAPDYMGRMDESLVNDKLFTPLSSGFTDGAPAIREATVKAVLVVAPKLKEKIRDNKVYPAMLKLLRDPEDAIRCNTMLCFGKLAPDYLQNNSKILLQAFSTSIKDPFPPCRTSAIQVVKATYSQYALEELTNIVLPNICSRLADPDPDVTKNAFEAIPTILSHVRDLVTKRNKEWEEKQKEEQMNQQQGGLPQSGQKGNDQQGWTNWALSGVASKVTGKLSIGGGKSDAQVLPAATPPPPPPSQVQAQAPPTKVQTKGAGGQGHGMALRKDSKDKFSMGSDIADAWGNFEDDVIDDEDPFADMMDHNPNTTVVEVRRNSNNRLNTNTRGNADEDGPLATPAPDDFDFDDFGDDDDLFSDPPAQGISSQTRNGGGSGGAMKLGGGGGMNLVKSFGSTPNEKPSASLKELMEADDDELNFGGPTKPKAKKLSGSGMALGSGMSPGGKAKSTNSTSFGAGMSISLSPQSKSAASASPSYKAQANSGTGFGMGKPLTTSSAVATPPSQSKAKAMPLNQQQSSFGSNPMNTSINNNSSFQSDQGNVNTSGRGMSLQSQSSAKAGGASPSPAIAKGGGKVEKPIAKKISVEFDDDVWDFE